MILGPLLTFPRSPPLSSSPSPLQRKRSCWMRSTASSRRPTLELPRRTRSRPAPSARTATSSSRAGPASCTVANRNINSGAGSCETPNMRYRCISRLKSFRGTIKAQASNVNIGAGSYADAGDTDRQDGLTNNSTSEPSPRIREPLSGVRYPLSIAGVLLGCTLAFLIIASLKGGPSVLVAALAKSGFTAAFMLIFISEIGDKTFFIAALLAMQYDKALVLLGSMGALSLMTILSVVIGRIFHSVPSQFQTTLPIGEYAAVALLTLFGLNSIKNAWELPSDVSKNSKESTELGELVEAEKLVKEKVAKKLTNPLEIIWKSSSLVFFAEWGDRSMLATIALGAAQSPWGVASGAITGHLFATSIAILGGALLANYISEKLVGYLGGVLFLIFAIATLLGVF